MKHKFLVICAILFSMSISAQEYDYKFRLKLKDKGDNNNYSIEKPEDFLSKKAIERRTKQNIKIDESDLPISDTYIKAIENAGGRVVAKSKWMQTIAVHCDDSSMVDKFKALPFVEDATIAWRGKKQLQKVEPKIDTVSLANRKETHFPDYHGFAKQNINIVNGQYLHEAGFKGAGVDIAVIDGGFSNLPRIGLLDNINIKGWKGFIDDIDEIFTNRHQHGTNVISCMATNKPHQFVGTAPEANYWLFNTEDSRSEFPIEEDYWIAAAEYADSLGIDVINTSLGYSTFHVPAKSYTHADLDGKTAHISKGAVMGVKKGMFIVASAGNSGNSAWQKLTPLGDAEGVLTVGAVRVDSVIAAFSSKGFTTDMRVKPEVIGLGENASVIGDNGFEKWSSGTSFSSPITCGLVACLWQAYPNLTNRELYNVIIVSSNRYLLPDTSYGYGIPDFKIAMQLGKERSDAKAAAQAKLNGKTSKKKGKR